jgi:Uma2 family endonuclease
MDSPHGNGVERTDAIIRAAFGNGWRFRIQLPLVLSLHTDPVPDIAVIAGTLVGSPGHPTTAALVIEIADTTLATDTTEKAELYATAGITDYWVLDVTNRELHVFREPQPLPAGLGATAYRRHTVVGPTDRVSPLAAPNASILVSELLP